MGRLPAYITAAVVGFFVVFALGFVVIPWLHKLRFGQTIPVSPLSRKKNKHGTPTMGGILFIASVTVSVAVVLITDYAMGGDIVAGNSLVPGNVKTKLFSGILTAFAYALIGFVDDYIKIVTKSNLGLSVFQKSAAQILVTGGYLFSLHMAGATYMFVPFYGNLDLGIFFWILTPVIMYCTVNAVSITDSTDGLGASVTSIFALTGIIIAVLRDVSGAGLLSSAILGSLIGYLIWNVYPAKVMTGATGSMFLGGMVIAVSYSLDMPWIVLLAGIVYVIEFASVVIQIVYFKATHGKCILKTAPLHRHLEKCGWKENKIVNLYSFINITGCILAVLLVFFGQPE